ncbi:integrase core domain-containing protein [Acinetobacter larvae]|uniref:integrase core domain-containing protein n=1 Tax=Acinetobacter larvae TaxID=1789224 RepID=UPI0009D75C9D
MKNSGLKSTKGDNYLDIYRPSSGFESLDQARVWVDGFIHWYNEEHRHSGISYVTPSQRHKGEDIGLLAQRSEVYRIAREAKPERWSKQIRNWHRKDVVMLNPERLKIAA